MGMAYTFKGLAHLCVPTRDMATSISFYRDLLGFSVEFQKILGEDRPSDGFWPVSYVLVRQGNCAVELLQPADITRVAEGIKGSVEHFALSVDDLDAAVADLRRRGAIFEGEIGSVPGLFGGFRSAFLRGPSGESIELCEITTGGHRDVS